MTPEFYDTLDEVLVRDWARAWRAAMDRRDREEAAVAARGYDAAPLPGVPRRRREV